MCMVSPHSEQVGLLAFFHKHRLASCGRQSSAALRTNVVVFVGMASLDGFCPQAHPCRDLWHEAVRPALVCVFVLRMTNQRTSGEEVLRCCPHLDTRILMKSHGDVKHDVEYKICLCASVFGSLRKSVCTG